MQWQVTCWACGRNVLGVAVFFACMTTSIGLTTSFADYFHELFPNVSYKKITAIVCSVQFCDQQHRFGYAGTGISSGSDDDLSGDRCTCDSFVFQKVDRKSEDGICTGNVVCVLCCICRWDAKCENYAGAGYKTLPAASVL